MTGTALPFAPLPALQEVAETPMLHPPSLRFPPNGRRAASEVDSALAHAMQGPGAAGSREWPCGCTRCACAGDCALPPASRRNATYVSLTSHRLQWVTRGRSRTVTGRQGTRPSRASACPSASPAARAARRPSPRGLASRVPPPRTPLTRRPGWAGPRGPGPRGPGRETAAMLRRRSKWSRRSFSASGEDGGADGWGQAGQGAGTSGAALALMHGNAAGHVRLLGCKGWVDLQRSYVLAWLSLSVSLPRPWSQGHPRWQGPGARAVREEALRSPDCRQVLCGEPGAALPGARCVRILTHSAIDPHCQRLCATCPPPAPPLPADIKLPPKKPAAQAGPRPPRADEGASAVAKGPPLGPLAAGRETGAEHDRAAPAPASTLASSRAASMISMRSAGEDRGPATARTSLDSVGGVGMGTPPRGPQLVWRGDGVGVTGSAGGAAEGRMGRGGLGGAAVGVAGSLDAGRGGEGGLGAHAGASLPSQPMGELRGQGQAERGQGAGGGEGREGTPDSERVPRDLQGGGGAEGLAVHPTRMDSGEGARAGDACESVTVCTGCMKECVVGACLVRGWCLSGACQACCECRSGQGCCAD